MLTTLLLGLALVCGLMLVLWLLHLPLRNAGIVDVGWTFGLGLLGALDAWRGTGDPQRRWLVFGMSAIWSLRLGLHLFFDRILGKPEEGRYVQLRKEWGGNLPLKFLAFFQFQGLLDLLLAWPFLLAAYDPHRVGPLEWVAVALWAVSIAGEAVADEQLKRFKARPSSRGKTCRDGLWSLSRHPNYFFEWLVWVAWFLFALPTAWGFTACVCPALMLYFLLRVTGIPATEAQALRTRGGDYRAYQRTTSGFVPWFPRRDAAAARG